MSAEGKEAEMVKGCPVCGKEFVVSWPGGWSYKKAGEYICSWKCLQKKREESKKMGEAGENRTTKGKAMENVELVLDESVAEEYRREQAQKEANRKARNEVMRVAEEGMKTETDELDLWQTAAVRNKKMGTFYYDEKYRTVDWRSPFGEEISLLPQEWKWLGDHIGMILHALGVGE